MTCIHTFTHVCMDARIHWYVYTRMHWYTNETLFPSTGALSLSRVWGCHSMFGRRVLQPSLLSPFKLLTAASASVSPVCTGLCERVMPDGTVRQRTTAVFDLRRMSSRATVRSSTDRHRPGKEGVFVSTTALPCHSPVVGIQFPPECSVTHP